jgi:RNA polymerase sigma-70 factor (ECF subfamily)
MTEGPSAAQRDSHWLADFHSGIRLALEQCYRDNFDVVSGAVGRVLRGADQETVIHEVFLRLLSDEELRRSFAGGSLRAWLATLGRNQAIDYRRRWDRERPLESAPEPAVPARFADEVEARVMIEQFRREELPAKWSRVFELRFLAQLDQREAARTLGISRTTLAYQELRVRALLRRYLRRGQP